MKFEIDDIEAEWSFTKRFDFIMGRYLMNGLRNYKAVIEQAYKLETMYTMERGYHADDRAAMLTPAAGSSSKTWRSP